VVVQITVIRSSRCRATGCAVRLVDRQRFQRSFCRFGAIPWGFVSFGWVPLVELVHVAG
jgi:hypothetical protein